MQIFLTILILLACIAYVIHRLWKRLHPPAAADGCSAAAGGCCDCPATCPKCHR
ncbi:MAG: FeoB-associated Cys-rich membrane protein [Bacteroidaceae bacterium]|nr:FeoB-associated Cys-rich membrane protein [Bacteroidaceae bacterium]